MASLIRTRLSDWIHSYTRMASLIRTRLSDWIHSYTRMASLIRTRLSDWIHSYTRMASLIRTRLSDWIHSYTRMASLIKTRLSDWIQSYMWMASLIMTWLSDLYAMRRHFQRGTAASQDENLLTCALSGLEPNRTFWASALISVHDLNNSTKAGISSSISINLLSTFCTRVFSPSSFLSLT